MKDRGSSISSTSVGEPTGHPGSSYDHTGGWNSLGDGDLETRQYFLQNWRADVVAVIDSKGVPIECVRYSPYGEPTVYAAGDMNADGVCDSADETAWDDLQNSTTGVRGWPDGPRRPSPSTRPTSSSREFECESVLICFPR